MSVFVSFLMPVSWLSESWFIESLGLAILRLASLGFTQVPFFSWQHLKQAEMEPVLLCNPRLLCAIRNPSAQEMNKAPQSPAGAVGGCSCMGLVHPTRSPVQKFAFTLNCASLAGSNPTAADSVALRELTWYFHSFINCYFQSFSICSSCCSTVSRGSMRPPPAASRVPLEQNSSSARRFLGALSDPSSEAAIKQCFQCTALPLPGSSCFKAGAYILHRRFLLRCF